MRQHDAIVIWLPFELHPEIPPGGATARELFGGRFSDEGGRAYRERMASLAGEVGLPYDPPRVIPNTHKALEATEWVRRAQPEAFDAYHRGVFDAYFARGLDIGTDEVLVEEAGRAGADADAVQRVLATREMRTDIDRATRDAIEYGVTGTPAWLMDGRFLVPGCQPRETFDRVIERMRSRPAPDAGT